MSWKKGEWIYILEKKIKYYAKELLKYFNITFVAFALIGAVILVKYKPIYKVSISGEEIGYVETKQALEESIKTDIFENNKENIDSVEIKEEPKYELKLVDKSIDTNKEEIVSKIEENIVVTYKYYEVAAKEDVIEKVNTMEEAEELVETIKEQNNIEDLSISEKYTQNKEDVETTDIEVAKQNIDEKTKEIIAKQNIDNEDSEQLPIINGIKFATKPVTGIISSRYGVSSRIRSSTHTGLDIATATGTPIKVVADGTVTCASYSGAYGNLVKIDHGNGLETWYAHTSKMYVKLGQEVKAGEVIAAVGSTGNSTGSHLHFEIRIDGNHVNPQNYLYNE